MEADCLAKIKAQGHNCSIWIQNYNDDKARGLPNTLTVKKTSISQIKPQATDTSIGEDCEADVRENLEKMTLVKENGHTAVLLTDSNEARSCGFS